MLQYATPQKGTTSEGVAAWLLVAGIVEEEKIVNYAGLYRTLELRGIAGQINTYQFSGNKPSEMAVEITMQDYKCRSWKSLKE